MELKNTVDLMLSKDFKDRFKAEYYQLKDRTEKLEKMLYGYRNNTLKFSGNGDVKIMENKIAEAQF